MEQVKSLLKAREKRLAQLKNKKEEELRTAPDGTLRICCNGDRIQYYQRTDPKDTNGSYLREEDYDRARRLAQKDYDQKILQAVEKEQKVIQRFLRDYPDKNVEQVYESLHRERQKLVEPILEPEEKYIQRWEAVQYEGKGFEKNVPEFYTEKGERVRSKSELIIADLLYKEGVPYRYEYPLYLNGLGRIYPDFTVLNTKERKELHWEHLGMMDDAEYAENALRRIAVYEKNGIFPGENLILTHETRKNPLDQKIIKMMIANYLK